MRPFMVLRSGFDWLSAPPAGHRYLVGRWLTLRLLGFNLMAGCLSLATQIEGLNGPHGILPAAEFLESLRERYSPLGAFLQAPSLLWLGAGSIAVQALAWGGALAGLCLMLNLWPRAAALAGWLFYLSFVATGRDFSGFQSDTLMLECLLLGGLLAPRGLRPGLGTDQPPTRLLVFALHFLAFRLMWGSGMAKLLSSDPSWLNGTALNRYYENCPFPNALGWFVQQLPPIVHRLSTLMTLGIEVILPWGIWLNRRGRAVTFCGWTVLMTGIMLTANYSHLNLNGLALGFMLLDDGQMRWIWRRLPETAVTPRPVARWRTLGVVPFIGLHTVIASGWLLLGLGLPADRLPKPLLDPMIVLQRFESANRYGLFAVMTTRRLHLVFEGSNDGGRSWRAYPCCWQPQAPDRAPRWIFPHHPRFDWNLWFAVLGEWPQFPFVEQTARGLLEGNPAIVGLFADNPFPDAPPEQVRVMLDQYWFTDWATWRRTGHWWRSQRIGEYAPLLKRLEDGRIEPMDPAGETR